MKQKDTSVKNPSLAIEPRIPPSRRGREDASLFLPGQWLKRMGDECTRKRVPAESGGHTRSSLRSVFIRQLIHATKTTTRSNVFSAFQKKKDIVLVGSMVGVRGEKTSPE